MAGYVSAAEVQAEADRLGLTWSGTDDEKDQAIARAQIYIDAMRWPGRRTLGRDQDSEWPRAYAYDREGWAIDALTVPQEIKTAAALLAIVESATPDTLSPVVTLNDLVKQEQVGALSVTYRDGTASGARPIITRVQDVVARLQPSGSTFELTRA